MTLSKLGRFLKRVSAFLCAALLILNLALYPLRARAMAGALTAVGAAVTVSAFLMACGIYPYVSDEGQSFGEWGAQSLYDLWSQYVETLEAPPNGGTTQEAFNNIKSFVVGGTLAIASGTWETLRGFASWIVSHFSLTDNQTGVQLGVVSGAGLAVPFVSASYDFSGGAGYDFIAENGVYACNHSVFLLAFSGFSGASAFYVRESGGIYLMLLSLSNPSSSVKACYLDRNNKYTISMSSTLKQVTVDGLTYDVYGYGSYLIQVVAGSVPDGQIVYDTKLQALRAFLGLGGSQETFSGVTADTTKVSALPALPADMPWGGLSVPEAGAVPTADALQDVIETGVVDRQKPVVRPVEVEIGTGTEVDSETGEITENPVVITPEDVVPTVAALSPPASFLQTLQTTMTTKFPFCLPFDLFKILQAFYVAPEAPVFSLSFHDPFSNGDFSITVDLSPWDEVAAVVRNFEAMILLAGFCLNFDKFNVIHLILGGLG